MVGSARDDPGTRVRLLLRVTRQVDRCVEIPIDDQAAAVAFVGWSMRS